MSDEAKVRPVLFSGAMVRAILAGAKTQTRRVVRKRVKNGGTWWESTPSDFADEAMVRGNWRCPYGRPGDRLWVREASRWAVVFSGTTESPDLGAVRYRADDAICRASEVYGVPEPTRLRVLAEEQKWRPSIHMPRWASRITLEVTGVRVERLQEITERDIDAEGVTRAVAEAMCGETWGDAPKPRVWWQRGWDSLNAKRGCGWDTNPWVWVVEFRKVGA